MVMPTTHTRQRVTTTDSTMVDFLDIAGHELRNPLGVLKAQVQLMQRRFRRQEGRESDLADLDRMAFQIERVNQTLDVFLEAARIAQARLVLQFTACDLAGIVERMVERYAAASRDHTVALEEPQPSATGRWDRMRIEQVLAILLSNAVKYSPRGEIRVRLRRDGQTVRVEVSDQGLGVPSADRYRIFQAYGRASNNHNPGIGLGLYVAREIVRQHGGRMGVRANKGGGSVFWFTLPVSDTSAPEDVPILPALPITSARS